MNVTTRDGKQTVSARELYEFLEVKTPLEQWKNNLECALFFEGGRIRMFDTTNGKKYDIYKIENEYRLTEETK
ncbi:MAG: hypothetical protein ACRCWQ_13745 [Bacilli bacterium]